MNLLTYVYFNTYSYMYIYGEIRYDLTFYDEWRNEEECLENQMKEMEITCV